MSDWERLSLCVAGHSAAGKTFASEMFAEILGGEVLCVDEIENDLICRHPLVFKRIYGVYPSNVDFACEIRRNGTWQQEFDLVSNLLPLINYRIGKQIKHRKQYTIINGCDAAATQWWHEGVLVTSTLPLRSRAYNKRRGFKDLNRAQGILLQREIAHSPTVKLAQSAKYKLFNTFDATLCKQVEEVCEDVLSIKR